MTLASHIRFIRAACAEEPLDIRDLLRAAISLHTRHLLAGMAG